MRPVADEFPVSQQFGSDATEGVVGDPNGTEVQQLVAAYGNYQPYGHAGQDIACPIGTPVHAIAAGTVIWADWGTNLPGDDTDAGYRERWYMYKNFPGIVTLIQHDGWISMYGHLSSNDAAPVGTVVTEGQLIGLSGNTKAPGVTLGAHLHVGALIDLTYSCGNGLIYGCTDPTPYYNTASTINVQSATITPAPAQEDDMALFNSLDEFKQAVADAIQASHTVTRTNIIDTLTANTEAQHVETRTQAVNSTQAQHDVTRGYLRDTIPANVLNLSFTLPDGTVTNLAGILAAINAKPATVTNVTNTPAPAPVVDPAAITAAILDALKTATISTKIS